MLEDLNNVLNTGELSNLFASDETDKIVSDMIPVCKAISMPETRENCLAYFVSRVRDKLHIVLCMSPVGDSLRIRCRQFPSLINCTNIDWFHGWPEAALVSVAGESEFPLLLFCFAFLYCFSVLQFYRCDCSTAAAAANSFTLTHTSLSPYLPATIDSHEQKHEDMHIRYISHSINNF